MRNLVLILKKNDVLVAIHTYAKDRAAEAKTNRYFNLTETDVLKFARESDF